MAREKDEKNSKKIVWGLLNMNHRLMKEDTQDLDKWEMKRPDCSPNKNNSNDIYGLGQVRSLEEFEMSVGVSFREELVYQNKNLNTSFANIKKDFDQFKEIL